MCQTKTILVSLPIILIVASIFCIHRTHTEKKEGHHSEMKTKGPCENEFKIFCLNCGQSFHPVGNVFVGCKSSWLYEENDEKSSYGGTGLEFKIEKR